MANDTKKPHVNIGTIGHVDHGKTTLTAAIRKTLEEMESKPSTEFNADVVEIDPIIEIKPVDLRFNIENFAKDSKLAISKKATNSRKDIKGTKVSSGEKSFKGKTRLLKRNFLGK